jgi:prepilin-type N-terminal cleavage/methylation domain-containing protein
MNKNKLKFNKSSAGFTLIELMVSLMIFSIVVLAAIGSLYTVNNASRKARAMQTVLDNLTFSIESISRTIRTGSSVACGGGNGSLNCSFDDQIPSTSIIIDSTFGVSQFVEYRLSNSVNGTGLIEKRVQENGVWSDWAAITSPEINIQNLSFYVDGAETSDGKQPQVSIFVQGVATISEGTAPFAIQTYVSQRSTQ